MTAGVASVAKYRLPLKLYNTEPVYSSQAAIVSPAAAVPRNPAERCHPGPSVHFGNADEFGTVARGQVGYVFQQFVFCSQVLIEEDAECID